MSAGMRTIRALLLALGVITCGMNAVLAMALGEDQRAIAIALLGLVLVQASAHIGRDAAVSS